MTAERMASADAAWLHMDQPTNRMVVNSVFCFERALDWARVRTALVERLVGPFPRFRQRVDDPLVTLGPLAAPSWVDDESFDIDRHLRHARLRRGGGSAAVQRYVSEHAGEPLAKDRPLWEAHLLDASGQGSAILLRTHHAIADGTSLMHVLLGLSDPRPGEPVDLPGRSGRSAARSEAAAQSGVPVLSRVVDATAAVAGGVPVLGRVADATAGVTGGAARLAGAAVRGYAGLLTHPGRLLDLADSARVNAAMLHKLGLGMEADHTELFGPLGVDKQVRWSRPVDLERIKAIGRSTGATVNDVMLGVLAGGIRRHLAAHGGEVKDVVVIVPYNVRSADEVVGSGLGNRFGLVFVRLPATVAGALDRIAHVKRQMDHIKTTEEGIFVYGVLAVAGQTPTQLQRAWIDLFAANADAIVTNVAGPREEVRLTGVPLRGFVAWVPATGPVGVGLSIVSYNGSVVIGLVVDAELVPDSAGLLRAIETEVREVERSAAAARHALPASRARADHRRAGA